MLIFSRSVSARPHRGLTLSAIMVALGAASFLWLLQRGSHDVAQKSAFSAMGASSQVRGIDLGDAMPQPLAQDMIAQNARQIVHSHFDAIERSDWVAAQRFVAGPAVFLPPSEYGTRIELIHPEMFHKGTYIARMAPAQYSPQTGHVLQPVLLVDAKGCGSTDTYVLSHLPAGWRVRRIVSTVYLYNAGRENHVP